MHWIKGKEDIKIVFKKPREICNCDWKLFFEIDEKNLLNNMYKNSFISSLEPDKEYFIKQTNIGDCFLVSTILSIINMPGILYDLFYFENENNKNYTDKDEDIYLYCYLNGKKELINIKNTYPGFKNEKDNIEYLRIFCSKLSPNASPIPFTTSKNGVLLGQILIKCFICLGYLEKLDNEFIINLSSLNVVKYIRRRVIGSHYIPSSIFISENNNEDTSNNATLSVKNYKMSEIYKLLNEGSFPELPMYMLVGCISEMYKNDIYNDDYNGYIIKKIIKYIDLGGFIQVCKGYKNDEGNLQGHAFSLLNYKKIEGKYYFLILNPWMDHTSCSFKYEKFNSDDIIRLTSQENPDIIKIVNHNHDKTGLMMIKEDIFFKWFSLLFLSDSMFWAKDLLFKIEENEIIKIKVNKKNSKICIDICHCIIKPYNINKFIDVNFVKIEHNNSKEKVKLSDNLFQFKIYEKLDEGNYELSFKYKEVIKEIKDIDFIIKFFFCRIKFDDKDIQINGTNELSLREYFPKVKKLNYIINNIFEKLIPPDKETKTILPQNIKDNKIYINYLHNYELFWIEPQKIFDRNDYKYEASNYKNVCIIKIYHLIYFVPIFIVIYYIQRKMFEVRAPENQFMTIDENFKILNISEGFNKFCKIGVTLFDYNSNVKKSQSNQIKSDKNSSSYNNDSLMNNYNNNNLPPYNNNNLPPYNNNNLPIYNYNNLQP